MPEKEKSQSVYIYGKHVLMEALTEKPQIIKKVFLSETVDAAHIRKLAHTHHIPVSEMSEKSIGAHVGSDASHQGVIALIDPEALMVPWETFIEKHDTTPDTALVLLDEVHDPQNVGAVIRSAAAFGIQGILVPLHNQAQITGSVVKVSAGMAFRIPLVRIGNVNTTIRALKEKGFWVYGLDMKGTPVLRETFSRPSVFVLGNESRGIREKTLEHCDMTLSIPMHPRAESLNASTAAAIVMHAWSAQHPRACQ